MTEIPVIETERLILRGLTEADIDAEERYWTSPRSRFTGGPKEPHEAWRIVASMIGHWSLRGFGMWAVEEKSTGLYCGRVGGWYPGDWPEPEIGWTLMEEAEGRGIAFEAAIAARAHAYDTLGWTTAISTIDSGNTRSQALAARLGATFEGMHDFPRGYTLEIWRHPGPEAL